jgi:hypothetical protein
MLAETMWAGYLQNTLAFLLVACVLLAVLSPVAGLVKGAKLARCGFVTRYGLMLAGYYMLLAAAPFANPFAEPALVVLVLMGPVLAVWLWQRGYLHSSLHAARLGLCGGCGYSLSGNESGVCPECGRPTGSRP